MSEIAWFLCLQSHFLCIMLYRLGQSENSYLENMDLFSPETMLWRIFISCFKELNRKSSSFVSKYNPPETTYNTKPKQRRQRGVCILISSGVMITLTDNTYNISRYVMSPIIFTTSLFVL